MKKALLFAAALAAGLFFASCGSNDDDPILGSWTQTSNVLDAVTSSTDVTDYLVTRFEESGTHGMPGQITFSANGQGTVSMEGESAAFTYTRTDNTLTLTAAMGVKVMAYALNGNTLLLKEDVTYEYDEEDFRDGIVYATGVEEFDITKAEVTTTYARQ